MGGRNKIWLIIAIGVIIIFAVSIIVWLRQGGKSQTIDSKTPIPKREVGGKIQEAVELTDSELRDLFKQKTNKNHFSISWPDSTKILDYAYFPIVTGVEQSYLYLKMSFDIDDYGKILTELESFKREGNYKLSSNLKDVNWWGLEGEKVISEYSTQISGDVIESDGETEVVIRSRLISLYLVENEKGEYFIYMDC